MNAQNNTLEHGLVPAGNIHRISNWIVPTVADLDVIPNLVVSDVHKVAYVSQGASFWLLSSVSPRAWVRLNNAYPVALSYGEETKDLTLQLSSGGVLVVALDVASLAEVLAAIAQHNESETAHEDIRLAIGALENALANLDSDQIAEGTVHLFLSSGERSKLVSLPTGAALASSLAGKESTLVAGSNVTIDRTNPQSPVISVSLPAPLNDTDELAEGQTNLYFTAARVRGTELTGLASVAPALPLATDSILQAVSKLQALATKSRWFTVTGSMALNANHTGQSGWITADASIVVPLWSSLPGGWSVDLVPKKGTPLALNFVLTGSDVITENETVITGPVVIFRTPEPGVFQVEGSVSAPVGP